MAVNNDDGSNWDLRAITYYLSALNMQSDWFFLVPRAYHFSTDNSLQSADKDQQESRAVTEKPHSAVVKFDMYIGIGLRVYAASHGPPCDSTALFIFWI